MTKDRAAQELNEIPRLIRLIDLKRVEVERIETLVERITPTYKQDITQGGRRCSLDDNIDKLSRAHDGMAHLVGALATCQENVNRKLAKIPDERMQQILVLRYVEELPWDDIADKMHYSKITVIRKGERALREYARISKS